MRLEQDLRQRQLDGRWEVWQKMPVRWLCYGQPGSIRDIYDDPLVVMSPEWLPVAVFASRDDAVRFWNASFLASKARAPEWAGDGFGTSLAMSES